MCDFYSSFTVLLGNNYERLMSGDVYFYSHIENPYPFTNQQLEVIGSASPGQVLCTTTGLDSIPKIFFLVENETNNIKVPCSSFKRFNLTSWSNI